MERRRAARSTLARSATESKMRTLVTGAAGFIGYHFATRLLERGDEVTGVDNFSPYYSVGLKRDRIARLRNHRNFAFREINLSDAHAIGTAFAEGKFDSVVHLAAQAGVRYSLENPRAYTESNLDAFVNVLEGVRHHAVDHFVYASSSSVYGANTRLPFSVRDNVDHPISLYAATKKANELMAHTYSHLFGIPTTGLRFFTVYGPWGRPDMAYFRFTESILANKPIDIYNHGQLQRDFTYIDDIVEGMVRVLGNPAQRNPSWTGDDPDPATSSAPYRLYNIGNSEPVELMRFIAVLEDALGQKARLTMREMQPGDVHSTHADVSDLSRDVGFRPSTPIEIGLPKFVSWYREYYTE